MFVLGIARLCYGYVPVMLRLCYGYVPVMLRLCYGYVPVMFRLCSGYVPVMFIWLDYAFIFAYIFFAACGAYVVFILDCLRLLEITPLPPSGAGLLWF